MTHPENKGDSAEESWRVFCAIELPPQTRMRLLSHIEKLRAEVPEVRASWSRESNIHLTLKFLGETPQRLVGKFDSAISRAVNGITPFPILISGSGVFPRPAIRACFGLGSLTPQDNYRSCTPNLKLNASKKDLPKRQGHFIRI